MRIWNDRKGTFSPLKAAVLVLVCLPGLWIVYRFAAGLLGSKPITEALHQTGLWSLRLTLITLAVTPFRLITGQNRVLIIRRMLGVAASVYLMAHFALYFVDQKFDLWRVASEIVLRFYLTIGFVALLMMAALGATSFDRAIRSMGAAAWNRLHLLVYPMTILGLWHGALQSKINATEHIVMAGVFLALMGVRVMNRRVPITLFTLFGLAIFVMITTACIEFGWYALATGISPWRIFDANFMIALQPRPALGVGMIAMSLPLLALFRRIFGPVPAVRVPRQSN
jgi:methionine sulfoxide reductase heme-binding subunit